MKVVAPPRTTSSSGIHEAFSHTPVSFGISSLPDLGRHTPQMTATIRAVIRISLPLPSAIACALLLTWGVVSPASAQVSPQQQRLAKTKTLTCTFSTLATGTWTGGTPSTSSATASRKVVFRNVNIDEGTADADEGFGGGFIVVRYSGDYLHLMQIQSAGPLYTTTVFARETKEGRLMAVHTRHEYTDVRLPNYTSRPEMYLGECSLDI